MTQYIEETRKLESVAWGAWSDFEQKVIAATTDKMKADTYDGQGDISIHPLVRLADAQAAIAAAEERGRIEERERWLPDVEFLLDRLYDINLDDDTDDLIRDWNGHVEPAIARLRAITKEPTP